MTDYLDKALGEALSPAGNDDAEGDSTDSIEKSVAVALDEVFKGRRYIDDPSEAPEDAEVQEGPRGGLYYEVSGGGTDAGGSGGGGEEPAESGGEGGREESGGAPTLDTEEAVRGHIDPSGYEWIADQYDGYDQIHTEVREAITGGLQEARMDGEIEDFDWSAADTVAEDIADDIASEASGGSDPFAGPPSSNRGAF